MSFDFSDLPGWPAKPGCVHRTEVNPGRKAELFPCRYADSIASVPVVPRVAPRDLSWEQLKEERRRYG